MLVLWCRHSSHIAHLVAEVEFWRLQFAHERQRAERAVDTLLGLKLGVAPITVPTREELRHEESEVEKLMRNPEFTQAGSVE
jgi:hypothetical protein